MKTYLVTGAAGFIGAALAKRLLREGNKVATIDNLSTGFLENIPEGVEFIEGNCQDSDIISHLAKYQFEAIYHIAGQSSGEISFDDPVYDLQTNTQSTLLLLKYARENNCKKFIYTSSMSVYGDQPDRPISECDIPKPKSFYGVGKLASEHYLRIYEEYGITSTALRLFNVYGPGQNMKNLRQGMVSIFIAQAIKDNNILVKGSKDRFRDFIFIEDVIDSLIAAERRQGNNFEVINISTGTKTTIESLIENLIDNLEEQISVEYSGNTPGDQFGITGDIAKAKNLLSWKPKHSLSSGLKVMSDWAKQF